MNSPIDNTRLLISGEEDSNVSGNEHFQTVLQARMSRRDILRGSLGLGVATLFGSVSLSACSSDDDNTNNPKNRSYPIPPALFWRSPTVGGGAIPVNVRLRCSQIRSQTARELNCSVVMATQA